MLLFAKISIGESIMLKAKLVNYFGVFMNLVDCLGLIMFYVAMILRFIPDYNCYLAAR
jgi:hypothetical protein